MPMSLTEIVQQLLDRIENHPIDWKLAITWIVIVAVGCWLWAEFIEYLESRRMRQRFSRPLIYAGDAVGGYAARGKWPIGGKRSIVFADQRRPME